MVERYLRLLSPSARLALLHLQDEDTWIELSARIPRIEDGRQRHYHHCIPPLIAAGLIEVSGTKQLPGRAIRDDTYALTERGREVRGAL